MQDINDNAIKFKNVYANESIEDGDETLQLS